MVLDRILAASDRTEIEVEVAAWGGKVTLRELSGAERQRVLSEVAALTDAESGKLAPIILAASLVGENGRTLVDGKTADEREAIVQQIWTRSATLLDRLCGEAMKLSALQPKAIEGAEGN
jgi:hypothetical protein